MPGSIRLIDIAAYILPVDTVVSRCLILMKHITALLYREIPGHVVDENIIYLLTAPAFALMNRDVLYCFSGFILPPYVVPV